LRAIEQFIGIAVESIDISIPDAVGFAQFTQYAEGFEQGVLASWPSSVAAVLDEINLVEGFASNLKTEVLLESIKLPDRWLLAKENGGAVDVRVRYLDDGIELEFNP
jgi:hypothetical protein